MTQEESRIPCATSFKCNICGGKADSVIQLRINKGIDDKYKHAKQMLFYVCKLHQYLYDKMQRGVDIKDLFDDTIDENI
jgi:hypothetical protein